MTESPKRFLSEEEAARLWKRAAELQAEAARQREAHASLPASESEEERSAPDEEGFDVEHVTQAAIEAGIGPEFVRLALAELHAGATGSKPTSPKWAARFDRFLENERRSIEVARVIRASPAAVLDAMQRVLPATPYNLVLKTTDGSHPLEGGVLVFEAQSLSQHTGGSWGSALMWSDMKEFLFTLEAVEDDPDACRVVVVAPLDYSRKLNFWMGRVATAVAQGAGGFGGLAGGAAVATALSWGGLVFGLAMALPAVGGLAVAGWLTRKGTNALYRSGLERGEKGLEELLNSLSFNARTGIRFLPGRPSPQSGAGGE